MVTNPKCPSPGFDLELRNSTTLYSHQKGQVQSFKLYCATSVMTYITPSVGSGEGSPLSSWQHVVCTSVRLLRLRPAFGIEPNRSRTPDAWRDKEARTERTRHPCRPPNAGHLRVVQQHHEELGRRRFPKIRMPQRLILPATSIRKGSKSGRAHGSTHSWIPATVPSDTGLKMFGKPRTAAGLHPVVRSDPKLRPKLRTESSARKL